MTKRISLVVTYDTEIEEFVVDRDASSILFSEGPCWDDELQRWVEEPEVVDDLIRRLDARLRAVDQSVPSSDRETVPVEAKFIELALNIIDPDDAWDPEETLEFGDAARAYLRKCPITNWEIEGAFALVAQFVHDWALSEAQGTGILSDSRRDVAARLPGLQEFSGSVTVATTEVDDPEFERLTSLETQDPLSGTTLRMVFGGYEGAPALALFVGEDEEPILVDRSALQIAVEEGWATSATGDGLAVSFRTNADNELEVIDFDAGFGPEFE